MKPVLLTFSAVALCLGVAGFAVHVELSARAHAYHELRRLRGEAHADLKTRRITQAKAAEVDGRLREARIEIEQDDVRGAQKLLDGAKAQLATRAA